MQTVQIFYFWSYYQFNFSIYGEQLNIFFVMTLKFNENKHPYIDLGQDFKISFDYGKVEDEKELSKAKDDIRETPEIREEALNELKELIKS